MAAPTCSICTLTFNETINLPKLLACGHTYCAACLAQHYSASMQPTAAAAKEKKAGGATTLKAAGDVRSLTTNYLILELLPSRPPASPTCSTCGKVAKMRCTACGVALCGAHSDEHEDNNAGHTCDKIAAAPLAAISAPDAAAPASPRRNVACKMHGRAMEYYCTNAACEASICDRCIIETHKAHDVQTVEKLEKERIAAAQALAAEARNHATSLQQRAAELAAEEARVAAERASVTAEVKSLCAAMRKALDEREAALLTDAAAKAKAELDRLAEARVEVETRVASLTVAAASGEQATEVYGALDAAAKLRTELTAAKAVALTGGGAKLVLNGVAQAGAPRSALLASLSVSMVSPSVPPPVPVAAHAASAPQPPVYVPVRSLWTFRPGPEHQLTADHLRATKQFSTVNPTVVLSGQSMPVTDEREFELSVCSKGRVEVGFFVHPQNDYYLLSMAYDGLSCAPLLDRGRRPINYPFKLSPNTPTRVFLRFSPTQVAFSFGNGWLPLTHFFGLTGALSLAVRLYDAGDYVSLIQ